MLSVAEVMRLGKRLQVKAAENFGIVVCFYPSHWVNCFPDTSAYKPGRDSDLRVLPSRVAIKIV